MASKRSAMTSLPLPLQATLWGAVAGGALLLGAFAGYYLRLPRRVSSAVMAFGVGVLISALSFNLMTEAFQKGGMTAAVAGFTVGSLLYALANAGLAKAGARTRKRAHHGAGVSAGASLAIAIGSLLDGVPESAAIGISLLDGEGVASVTVLAVFISNIPEGMSSAAGMRRAGKKALYVFGLWGAIAIACALSAAAGAVFLGSLGPAVMGAAIACAAGAILVMLIDTMIPEAFDDLHALSGPIAALGFLIAFFASHVI